MIRPMLKTLGRSIVHFFTRPAPTSAALMVGPNAGACEIPREDAQLLRRAMRAASAAETARIEPVLELPSSAPASPQADEPVDEARDEVSTAGGTGEEAIGAALDESESEAAASEELQADEGAGADDPPAEAKLPSEYVFVEIDEAEPSHAGAADVVEHDTVEIAEEPAPAEAALTMPEAPTCPLEDLAAREDLVPGVGDLEPADDTAPEEIAASTVPERAAAAWPLEEMPSPSSEPLEPLEAISSAPLAVETGEAFGEPATEDQIADGAPAEVTAKKPRKKRAAGKRKAAAKPRKPKAEQPAEPVPEDDVWVSDAVAWSLSGEWSADDEWSPPESTECPRRLEELREAAAEGRLTIWGRSDDAGTWQPIEPSYWKSGTVEPESLTQGRENVVAEPKTPAKTKSKKAARKYSALKVSKSQVEELWSPEAMH